MIDGIVCALPPGEKPIGDNAHNSMRIMMQLSLAQEENGRVAAFEGCRDMAGRN